MYNEFENRTYHGIYYSRFVASFFKENGKLWDFKDWLHSLIIDGEPIPDDIIQRIYYFADNGKLELEEHAAMWLKENNKI